MEDHINNNHENEKNPSSSHHTSYDTCYHILKLYSDSTHSMESLASPLNHTRNRLDTRLSWHLIHSLASLDYNHASTLCLDSLTQAYASQLDSMSSYDETDSMWHWSLFVLMHTSQQKERESLVRAYLSRHVTSESELNEQERFVIDKLCVPYTWVYEYKALKAKYKHEHVNQLESLIKSHKWNEAHLVLIEHLAPDLFLMRKFF